MLLCWKIIFDLLREIKIEWLFWFDEKAVIFYQQKNLTLDKAF